MTQAQRAQLAEQAKPAPQDLVLQAQPAQQAQRGKQAEQAKQVQQVLQVLVEIRDKQVVRAELVKRVPPAK